MLLRDVQPHSFQLPLEVERDVLRVVSEEQEPVTTLLKPFDELPRPRHELVPTVDDPVHIQNVVLHSPDSALKRP